MPPILVTSNYTLGDLIVTTTTLNVTVCLEEAQQSISLSRWLFTFGAFLPILLWPVLPSTSERHNYSTLLLSSCMALVFLLPWAIWGNNAGDGGPDFQFWLTPLLCCCAMLGHAGYTSEKDRKRLERKDVRTAAVVTFGLLAMGMLQVGEYVFRPHPLLTMTIMMTSCVICKPLIELVMTAQYRFATRQIPALYWLPQNGAECEFKSWWSGELHQDIVVFIMYLLMYASLSAVGAGSSCRL